MKRARLKIDDRIVHTGQHYDDAMSKIFFEELEIPQPTVNLGVGSGPQGRQTARMLEAIEAYLSEIRPDAVIVYGDTNSTLAGALAAAKLHIPVAHVEAGLRSFNRRMPEELNRIATDHLSDILFAPTSTAIDKLTTGEYGIATIHRAENTTPDELSVLLQAINDAASRFGRIIFPMHPRTSSVLQSDPRNWHPAANLVVTGPLSYLDMLALIQGASWVLTDSGGLQKEAFFLNCPCVTLRNETEWVETLRDDANCIAGSDGAQLAERLTELTRRPRRSYDSATQDTVGPFGTGHAAQQIVEAIC